MIKKLVVIALLAASVPAPAQAKAPERAWWCGPSGQDNYTPIKRLLLGWTC